MSYLEQLHCIEDLRALPESVLPDLAAELRQEILAAAAKNGGHLASSLGCVELITALHYVFDTPEDKIIYDVGHQSYAHKILTGRRDAFQKLRRKGGCSGFPFPAESPEFDPCVSGHAGSALASSVGLAAAARLNGGNHKIIAVVGDASLNCGISLEALNNAKENGRNLIVILNDNKMSISRNVGATARYLNGLIAGERYNRLKNAVRGVLLSVPRYRNLVRRIHKLEDVVKHLILPGSLFEEFGFRYFGPVDGNDLTKLLPILKRVKTFPGPIFLHVVTRKGCGYSPAEAKPDVWHGVPPFDAASGALPEKKPGWSEAFGDALMKLAEAHPEVVAITAGMTSGTGLASFAQRYADRFFDTGIAEEFAAVFAGGLAAGGKRPFCAIYATFFQRALDCLYHDVLLANRPVVFALDRAGAVEDGPTHHGIYDLGFLRGLPNLTIMEPSTEAELELMMMYAYTLERPVVIRYPRGRCHVVRALPPLELGRAEILEEGEAETPLLIASGAEVNTAIEAAQLFRAQCGRKAGIVNARFLAPFDAAAVQKLAAGRPVVTLEDHRTTGGLASAVAEALILAPHGDMVNVGWGSGVVPHGAVSDLRSDIGLGPEAVADTMRKLFENQRRG